MPTLSKFELKLLECVFVSYLFSIVTVRILFTLCRFLNEGCCPFLTIHANDEVCLYTGEPELLLHWFNEQGVRVKSVQGLRLMFEGHGFDCSARAQDFIFHKPDFITMTDETESSTAGYLENEQNVSEEARRARWEAKLRDPQFQFVLQRYLQNGRDIQEQLRKISAVLGRIQHVRSRIEDIMNDMAHHQRPS